MSEIGLEGRLLARLPWSSLREGCSWSRGSDRSVEYLAFFVSFASLPSICLSALVHSLWFTNGQCFAEPSIFQYFQSAATKNFSSVSSAMTIAMLNRSKTPLRGSLGRWRRSNQSANSTFFFLLAKSCWSNRLARSLKPATK